MENKHPRGEAFNVEINERLKTCGRGEKLQPCPRIKIIEKSRKYGVTKWLYNHCRSLRLRWGSNTDPLVQLHMTQLSIAIIVSELNDWSRGEGWKKSGLQNRKEEYLALQICCCWHKSHCKSKEILKVEWMCIIAGIRTWLWRRRQQTA